MGMHTTPPSSASFHCFGGEINTYVPKQSHATSHIVRKNSALSYSLTCPFNKNRGSISSSTPSHFGTMVTSCNSSPIVGNANMSVNPPLTHKAVVEASRGVINE